MRSTLAALTRSLDRFASANTSVISWGSPIPSFGDVSRATVASLGLNPSNREFLDAAGNELDGAARRFHTLGSLGLSRWIDANPTHLRLMYESCLEYFRRNPYDGWFKRLDYIVAGTRASYYAPFRDACHLDLFPYATACKWTELTHSQRCSLIGAVGDALGVLLRDSPIQMLLLNGQAVVENFERLAGVRLNKRVMPTWTLPRQSGRGVPGFAYTGVVHSVSGVGLGRRVAVLGYNHNVQSSFGVTTNVMFSIRRWVARSAEGVLA
jgi:hypothetical protein